MRLLLVDDEPMLLDALKRSLRMERPAWEVVLATSGAQALALIAQSTFDIVVTETLMAGVDGLTVLRELQNASPSTIRVVLSGQPRLDLMEAAEANFHRFLSKPLDPEILVGVLEELALSEGEAGGENARKFVAGLKGIPTLPAIYGEIRALLEEENFAMNRLTALFQRDLGIASKLLKLVNSAYFSLERKVTDLGQAVNMLGLDTVKTVVLVRGTLQVLRSLNPNGIELGQLWEHSQGVANGARSIASGEGWPPAVLETAYSLGLLHDIGRVIMALAPEVQYGRVLTVAKVTAQPVVAIEQQLYGTDHARVGAHVLSLWGLPAEFCAQIREHHSPSLPQGRFPSGLVLHAADGWTRDRDPRDPFQEGPVDLRILGYGDPGRAARWEGTFARDWGGEPPAPTLPE